MTGADTKTIMKLLGEVGQVCSDYQDEHLRDLECKKIQCDEIWSYCAMKEKNVPLKKVNLDTVMFIHGLPYVLIRSLSRHGI